MSARGVTHAVEYLLARGTLGVLGLLPESAALALGAALGRFAGGILRIRRRTVEANLALAFPDRPASWRRRVAGASYAHLGREAVATFRIAARGPEEVVARTTLVGLDAFQVALDEGRGVVLVTGHLGNWEVGGGAFSARGVPLDAVAKGMANTRLTRLLRESRRRVGVSLIEAGEAPREALRALRAGRVVALIADQDAREQGLFVPFFGAEASTFRGPALFALRTGAPIFLGTCLREPGATARYLVRVERIPFTPTGDHERDVRTLTLAHARALERAVLEAPDQYLWQHKRWKTRPAGGQEPRRTPPVSRVSRHPT